jgi:RNA-directed DNA polymerase
VPATAILPGEVYGRFPYAEPLVWTERMLAALATGVKGGKWYSLIDKLHPEPVLRAAFVQVRANHGAAGVDRVTVEMFESHLEENLERLSEALRTGSYRPQSIRRHFIPKAGSGEMRPLGIPTVRDRVVQTALRMVLEPIFESSFAPTSFGFRPARGCKPALRRVDELLKAGYRHVVDVDLRCYFDTIPHRSLMALVGRKVADGRLLALIESFLAQGVLEGAETWTPEEGTPQGAVISPLLSNIYLDPLDHLMIERGFEMVRYADDLVVLCRGAQEAAEALDLVRRWTAQAGLALHPDKTRVVDAVREGFEFLGYRFVAGRRWPRKRSLAKLKDSVRAKTKRNSGHSLPAIIADLNRTLCGWFAYFQHSHRATFPSIDGFVRRRLRSLLRKRRGRKGNAHGADHQRWPNAFFASHGLFSLQAAHALARQSSCR